MKSTTTVRVDESTHSMLQELAEQSQTSMNAVIEAALREYRKRQFWIQAEREFKDLRANEGVWQAERDETAVWDACVADGLDGDDDR